jgi:hypothetical protein
VDWSNTAVPIRDRIMSYVEHYGGGVSFAELRRHVPDFRSEDPGGGFALGEWDRNVLIWPGMSKAASAAIDELVAEAKIYFKSTSLLVYLVDGLTLQLPLAKPGIRKYKSRRWLPVAIYPGAAACGGRGRADP